MRLDRLTLLSFIALQFVRLHVAPAGLVEALMLLAFVRMYVVYPPSGLASLVRRAVVSA
jgi:hypothetical protein